MPSPLAVARNLLRDTFGHVEFRPLQARIIHHVLCGRDVLAVLPTGGGKSLCFQIPALTAGRLTVVVSPLIALMQDQVAALTKRGIAAAAINSDCEPSEQAARIADAASGRIRLLYVSPERLPRLAQELRTHGAHTARLAVDEAHCIVEWGHDFRPAYRALRRAREALGDPPCIAVTGTATPDVRREIARSLGFGRDAREIVGSFDRPNLRFDVVPVTCHDERLSRLARLVANAGGASIVYAPTRSVVESIARTLTERGLAASPYHAGMTAHERATVLHRFLDEPAPVIVATCAFGMGIDKASVRLVAHWTIPATPESYYQEAGRAGRDQAPARCVLFHHPRDADLPRRHLGATFPPERLLERLWREPALRHRQPARIVASADRLAAELRPDRGAVDWARVRRRRREASRRLDLMIAYAGGRRCRRRVLLGWFGEAVDRCNQCDRCSPAR
ncbi:MAG: RecQ family ATP-dependent DNA helicase [Gemmatimonadales bacterium]